MGTSETRLAREQVSKVLKFHRDSDAGMDKQKLKVWGYVLLVGLLLGVVTLTYPRTALDSPTFTHVAGTILAGGAPYRDAWDVKGPGIHLVYATVLLSFGKSPVALRLFDLLWQMATALCLAAIAQRVFRGSLAPLFCGPLYLLFFYSHNYWHFAQPDGFLSLPLAVSFLLVLRAMETDGARNWLGSAAAVGVAATLKLPFGLFGIICMWAAARSPFSGNRLVLRRFVLLAAGLALPFISILLFLWMRGGLQDYFTSQFVIAPRYAAMWRDASSWSCIRENLLNPGNGPLFLALLFVLGWKVRSRGASWPLAQNLVLGWAGIGLLVLVAHGAYLPYHFLPLAAPMAVLATAVIAGLGAEWPQLSFPRRCILALVLATALFVPAFRFVGNAQFTFDVLRNGHPAPPWQALLDRLKGQAVPEDTLFVWGNVPAIYVDSGLRCASRFSYVLFPAQRWGGADLRATLWNEIRNHPPAFFVLVKKHPAPVCPAATSRDEWETFMAFPELQQLIARNYALDWEDSNYALYRRKLP